MNQAVLKMADDWGIQDENVRAGLIRVLTKSL